jgi:uncharacterized repeat protein (TIGR01451 family)
MGKRSISIMLKNQLNRSRVLRKLTAQTIVRSLLTMLLAAYPLQSAMAQVAPLLGKAQGFAVLGSSNVTSTGLTTITGDLGVSPGTVVTGFPPGTVTKGTIHTADTLSALAQSDVITAYNNLAGQACDFDLTGQDLSGMTLAPAAYCFSSSAQLTGLLTLNAGGNPNAVWVFIIGSTLTTASNTSVQLTNGGQDYNVFWQVGSSATLGTGTAFKGNILALTSITLTTGTTLSGRALVQNGVVTLDSNTVSLPPVQNPPTVAKVFTPNVISTSGVSTLTITLTNSNPVDISGVAFSDIFPSSPSQMVIATMPNLSNSCGGTVTTTGSNSLALAGGTIPHNGSCTVRVDISASTAGSYTNNSGLITSSNAANGSSAAALLQVSIPAISVLKSANTPAINSGQEIAYTITIRNPNPFVINNVEVVDSMSPYTALKFGSFQLIDGVPVSGLNLGSTSLSFSNNNGSTWSYVPVSGQGGQPAGYDGTVTNWKVIMNPSEAMNGNNAYYLIQYSVLAR